MADPLAEKLVQPAINPKHLAYCPTMDLIALVSIDEHIHVYRLNGQKVFGITNKQSANKVSQIKWKPNGESNIFPVLSATRPMHILSLLEVNRLLLPMTTTPFL